MRHQFHLFVFAPLVASFFALPTPAQQGQSKPVPPQSKDAQAIAILTQVLSVAGGTKAISEVTDYSATGHITYHLAREIQGSVTIRGSGLDQVRLDADLGSGIRSEATSQGEVNLRTEDGTVSQISPQAPLSPPSIVLPYLLLAPILNSSGFSVSYNGIVNLAGTSAHDIQIQRLLPTLSDPNDPHREYLIAHFFIDASSFHVLMMRDVVLIHNIREILYSDYRVVDGKLVPFSIEQKGGHQPCSIQLDHITFNAGVQDSEFHLEEGRQKP
jgi:hypothetical protein